MKNLFELPEIITLSGTRVESGSDLDPSLLGRNDCAEGGGSANGCGNGSGSANGCSNGSDQP